MLWLETSKLKDLHWNLYPHSVKVMVQMRLPLPIHGQIKRVTAVQLDLDIIHFLWHSVTKLGTRFPSLSWLITELIYFCDFWTTTQRCRTSRGSLSCGTARNWPRLRRSGTNSDHTPFPYSLKFNGRIDSGIDSKYSQRSKVQVSGLSKQCLSDVSM